MVVHRERAPAKPLGDQLVEQLRGQIRIIEAQRDRRVSLYILKP